MLRFLILHICFKNVPLPANELYQAAMSILNHTKQDEQHAYDLLSSAAELGHTEARQKVAWARLLGRHLKQNITQAAEIFEDLAIKGNAEAQMVRNIVLVEEKIGLYYLLLYLRRSTRMEY